MATVDLSVISYYVTAVLSDGRQLKLEKLAENIAWEENERELAVRLNLTLRDVAIEGKRLAAMLSLCTVVYLFADWGLGQKEVFRGSIWEWEHSQIDGDAIVVTCYDMLYYLQKSKDNRYYKKGTQTREITTDILNDWNVPIGEYTAPNYEHEKLLYKGKAVSAMLTETLDDAKKLGGGKSIVRAKQGKADIIAQGSNTDIYSFTAETNLTDSKDKYSMSQLVTRVVVAGKDDSNGRPKVEATIDGKTEYGILQEFVNLGSSSLKEAKQEAEELLEERGTPKRTITLQAPDLPLIRKGDLIHVKLDRVSGYFYVVGVSHNATSMTMRMEVEPKK